MRIEEIELRSLMSHWSGKVRDKYRQAYSERLPAERPDWDFDTRLASVTTLRNQELQMPEETRIES